MLEDGGGVGVGIIPAYAGLTLEFLLGRVCIADHPRIRGVNLRSMAPTTTPTGSSPHTRG